MPLSGRFSCRYSLSLQDQVNESMVGSVSSFASNAKGDQSFALQTSAEKSTHHLQEVWPNEHILCCAKKVVAHWTLSVVFGSNFINRITGMFKKYCNYDDKDANKDKAFIQSHSPQLWLLNYFHIQQPQLEFINSVSTASFVVRWIWPFLLDGALENLFNWHLPMQRYFI